MNPQTEDVVPGLKWSLGSHDKLVVALVVLALVVVGFVAWDYYREWKIRRFYRTKPWKRESGPGDNAGQ